MSAYTCLEIPPSPHWEGGNRGKVPLLKGDLGGSHTKYLHNLIPQMVDDLDGDAA